MVGWWELNPRVGFFLYYYHSLVNQDAAILLLHLVVASNHTVNAVVVNQDIRNKIHKK